MPLINGRYYTNPAYGAALERARQAEAPEFEDELPTKGSVGGVQSEDEVLANNPGGEPEFEELAARQAGNKQTPAPQHKHVPNSSHVTEYPDEKKIGGSASWRNNNPANIMHGSFAKAHGATGKDHLGRAVFPTMRAGEDKQDALWNSTNYQGLTIREAAKTWSGSKNPVEQRNYVNALSEAAAAPPSTPVSDLDPDQLERLKESQKHQEGFRPGIVEPKEP